jgi:outer membrane protein assembly factor BamB
VDARRAQGRRQRREPDWGLASSPLVHGDHVVVQAGKGGAVAVAANKADGKVAWVSQAKGVGGYAQVIAADVGGKPQLIAFGGTALFGLDPATGKTLWQQPWKTSYDVNAATPVYDGKGNLLIASGTASAAACSS